MKNIAIGIFVALIVVTLGLYLVSFQVRETESCVVTTFGRATADDEITAPGVYFKWPFPIQQLHKFDSRMQVFEPEPEETTTAGGEPIIVNAYVVWKVAKPLEFFNAIKTVTKAQEELLRSRVRNTQNNVMGRHAFAEFVNSDPSKVKFEEIENEMLADLQQSVAAAKFGIKIQALGVKLLKISKDVSTQVFERMRAERNRKAEKILAEGNSEAIRIRTDAKSKSDELIAAAEARAKVVRGEGDAEAARHYERLKADPELAMLLRNLESLQKIFENRTTFVIPTDIEPFSLLKRMPDIKPKESK